MTYLAYLLMLLGSVFCLLGGLGVLRMPDAYNRLQAGTKAVTLGTLSIIAGVAVLKPDWIPKLLVLAIFITITNPVGSSTLARAFLRAGIKPWRNPADTAGSGDKGAVD